MNKKITKIDIIKEVSDETEIPYYKIKHIIDIFIDKLGDSIIQNDLVNIINLGSFENFTDAKKARKNAEEIIYGEFLKQIDLKKEKE